MVKILISKLFSIFIAVILLGGCANGFHPLSGLGLNLHNQEFWKAYNTAIEKFEGEAEAGKITWVEAATKIRFADWNLAQNAYKFDSSWKFDSNDEEFHQYSIALAERVDKRRISVAQYKAMKLKKFNEVQSRQETISNQSEQLRLIRENQKIIKDGLNKTTTCNTIGGILTCN